MDSDSEPQWIRDDDTMIQVKYYEQCNYFVEVYSIDFASGGKLVKRYEHFGKAGTHNTMLAVGVPDTRRRGVIDIRCDSVIRVMYIEVPEGYTFPEVAWQGGEGGYFLDLKK